MATNTLGVYNPIFYAQEALIALDKALGMASRVHLGYDEERRSFQQGETVNIRRPSTFTAQNAPSAAQNVATGTVAITLNQWKEVKFALTDKELAFTGERIINDHIRPAAYALADNIDQALAGLHVKIPWYYDLHATGEVKDITGPHRILFDNKVPMSDIGNIHYMMDGTLQEHMLNQAAFSQAQGAGDEGVNTQRRGSLGMKFGMECFSNQNVASHTAGTCADAVGAIDSGNGGYSAGVSLIHIDAVTDGGTWLAGDSFVIAGNTQRYVVTATATFTGGEGDVSFYPALVADAAEDAVVTGRVDSHSANLAFHRNAFALVTAPLSEMGNELGARIATVQDPITGLSLRSRLYYIPDSSLVNVALDVLYGYTCLDPNLAVRCCGA